MMAHLPPNSESPLAQQTLTNTTVGGNVNQSILLADGSIRGAGIWRWDEWCERAVAAEVGPLARATRAVLNYDNIERPITGAMEAVVATFASSTLSNLVVTVTGRHGSGLSTALARVAKDVADGGLAAHLYVADDVGRFMRTDLTRALPASDLIILMIDDADLQQATRPIYNALGAIRLCVVATVTDPNVVRNLQLLNRKSARPKLQTEFHMAGLASSKEIEQLQELYNRTELSARDRRLLSRANFRSAVAIVRDSEPTIHVAQELLSLALADDPTIVRAAQILMLAGEYDVPLPGAMLARAVGQPLHASLRPWIQSRPIAGSQTPDESLVWFENRDAVRLAAKLWKADWELDERSWRERLILNARDLLAAANPHAVRDRIALRQILRRLPFSISDNLVTGDVARVVEQSIGVESDLSALLGWADALRQGSPHLKLVLDKISHIRGARGGAQDELLSLLVSRNSEELSSVVAKLPGILEVWDDAAWVDMLEGLAAAKWVPSLPAAVRTTAHALARHPHCTAIMTASNSVQNLCPLVAQHGSPEQRIWLQQLMIARLGEARRPHEVELTLDLTARCIQQGRNALALPSVQQAARADLDLVKSVEAEFARLLEEEDSQELAKIAIDAVEAYIGDATIIPGAMMHIWESLLSFMRSYAADRLPGASRAALEYMTTRQALTPFKDVHAIYNAAAMALARTRTVGASDLPLLLWPFKDRSVSPILAPAFTSMLLAVATSELDTLATLASNALRAVLLSHPRSANAMDEFLENAELLGDLDHHYLVPDALTPLSDIRTAETIVRRAVPLLNVAFPDQSALVRHLTATWGAAPNLASLMFKAQMNAGSLGEAAALRPSLWRDDATWIMLSAELAARSGALAEARRLVESVVDPKAFEGRRAHPDAVSRCAREMARATGGHESRIYSLVAELTRRGALRWPS